MLPRIASLRIRPFLKVLTGPQSVYVNALEVITGRQRPVGRYVPFRENLRAVGLSRTQICSHVWQNQMRRQWAALKKWRSRLRRDLVVVLVVISCDIY